MAKITAGGDRDGRSHVGDKRPCDAGWDGGGEKKRGVRSAEKRDGMTNEVGCRYGGNL